MNKYYLATMFLAAGGAMTSASAQPQPENPIPPSGGAIKFMAAEREQSNKLPYSRIVEANGVLYLAGHIGRDPETGELPGKIREEAHNSLLAITATLNSVDASLKDIVRCTVFLDDMGDFKKLNEVYGMYFPKNPPARTTVAVKDLPLGAKVEIECTGVRDRAAEGGR